MQSADIEIASLEVLEKLTRSDVPRIRGDACCVVGDRLRTQEITDIPETLRMRLHACLHDDIRGVCLEAAIALAELQDQAALETLVHMIAFRGLRLDAIRALGRLGDPRGIAPLHQFLGKWLLPWADKLQASAALCALGDTLGAAYLVKRTQSRRFPEAAAALHFIGENKHPNAVEILTQALRGNNTKLAGTAARTLAMHQIRSAETEAVLRDELQKRSGELAEEIAEAITSLP